MSKKTIKITIAKDGSHTILAESGFSGTECISQTEGIELLLGGTPLDEGKTDDYYKDDGTSVNTYIDALN